MDGGALYAAVHGVAELDTTEQLTLYYYSDMVRPAAMTAIGKIVWELPLWSSGQDSMFLTHGAQVQSLVRELDPACCN